MRIQDVVSGLHSAMRRNILQLLCEKDRTAVEIYKELKENAPRFRQSVNRELEILFKHGFIRKYYEEKRKALYYQIIKKELYLDLKKMSVK
jgi:Fe2+ or Zn2+ uptake regulation protein